MMIRISKLLSFSRVGFGLDQNVFEVVLTSAVDRA